jgi:hypothetical protein
MYNFKNSKLYIANNREKDIDEVLYKIIIQFITTMNPEIVMANIDIFLKNGKKTDVLYFLQCPAITKKVTTYINHRAKNEQIFSDLLNGKITTERINRLKYPKKTSELFYKILDEPKFNGLIA